MKFKLNRKSAMRTLYVSIFGLIHFNAIWSKKQLGRIVVSTKRGALSYSPLEGFARKHVDADGKWVGV